MRSQFQLRSLPAPAKPHALPRIAKVSMLYGKPNSMYEGAIQSHTRHAARWGYPMHVLRQDIAAGFWNKPTYLLAMIVNELSKPADERIEWMMWVTHKCHVHRHKSCYASSNMLLTFPLQTRDRWVDADSILINPEIPAEIFLPPADLADIHAVATKDHNGLNTGIIFVRVHPWTVTMLSETIGYPLHHPEVGLGGNADQDVMAGIFKKQQGGPDGAGYANDVIYIPRPLINAYEFSHGFEGERGSFIVHFPGMEEARWSHMAGWLSAIEKTPGKWEVPLPETPHANTTDVFWRQVRAARAAIRSTERDLASSDKVVAGTERDVNDAKLAVELMKDALREQSDDLELMQARIAELERLRTVIGWNGESEE
ncbi:hypothetical protein LLEC1_05921 [Akanthomyces lecanii]|uniref:Uncharacterized protein n=1 Tax=Cordyceps confragosa TaxID=2714763 RepID=A0A179ID49_CORDF|nr:hypothetical protein LLEC1_05921 [Akanthomyces lecanii]